MLTDTKIRASKPQAKPYKVTDSNGLFLEVRPSGAKIWRYRFRIEGKELLATLGSYGDSPRGETEIEGKERRAGGVFTLSEARQERVRLRGLVKQGINPTLQARQEKARRVAQQSITLEAVAEEWLTEGIKPRHWGDETRNRRRSLLQRLVYPSLGKFPVADVTPYQILELLKKLDKENGNATSHEVRRSLCGVYQHAIANLKCDQNPTLRLTDSLHKSKTQHKPVLTGAEVGALLRDFEGFPSRIETEAAFKLMWWTLARPGEVEQAEWSEIDLDNALWVVPFHKMKMRKEQTFPLPTQAVEMLRALKGVTGAHRWVFPGRDDKKKPISINSLRTSLRSIGWSGKYSPHATRSTGSTILNGLGYSADWIEKQLAHGHKDRVRQTYNHATYLEGRKEMMQEWANLLDSWKIGGDVVPINKQTKSI